MLSIQWVRSQQLKPDPQNPMKLSSLILALAVLPAAAFAAAISIPGGTHSTPYVITKPGSYVLDANRVMTNTSKNAIEINAADVTLNLNGHAVSFASASGSGYGIFVPLAMNIEIRNGSLVNMPGHAVLSDNVLSVGLRLIDLRISDTRGVASNATGTLVERCQITDTEGTAIRARMSGTVVRNCTILNATAGGITVGGGSQVVGNVVDMVGWTGINFQVINASDSGGLIADNMVRKANTAALEWGAGIQTNSEVS
jgi:hypothetical protein